MAVFGISTIIPLVWALIVTFYWRFKMKEPVNHWLVCLLVFCVNFFWFVYVFVIFLMVMIFKTGILHKKEESDEDANK